MIVLDASAAVSALLTAGPARDVLADEQLHVPHLIDAEVANAVRRGCSLARSTPMPAGGRWTPGDGWE